MNIDKVYIITLDHSEENKRSLVERLELLGVPNPTSYNIIEGVNGRELFSTEAGRTELGVRFYDKWKLDGDVNGFWKRNVTVGEAGGMCSHIKVWEDAYENGYENILILEDDFEPLHRFYWEAFDELDGYDYDIAFLSRILQDTVTHDIDVYDSNIGLKYWVNPGYSYQTHSYVLNKSGLRKLVENHLPILKNNIVVSDEFLPAVYTIHPREDMRSMYVRDMNAIAYKWRPVVQSRNEAQGNSQTEPIEGIDY